jgi:hypothetical protein
VLPATASKVRHKALAVVVQRLLAGHHAALEQLLDGLPSGWPIGRILSKASDPIGWAL